MCLNNNIIYFQYFFTLNANWKSISERREYYLLKTDIKCQCLVFTFYIETGLILMGHEGSQDNLFKICKNIFMNF